MCECDGSCERPAAAGVTKKTCGENIIEVSVDCILAINHLEDHCGIITWARAEPSPPHKCADPSRCHICRMKDLYSKPILEMMTMSLSRRAD